MAQTPETPDPWQIAEEEADRAFAAWMDEASDPGTYQKIAVPFSWAFKQMRDAKALTDQRHAEQIADLTATVDRLQQENKIAEVAFHGAKAAELLAGKLYEEANAELTQLRQQLAEREQECETERMRLAACMTAALGNTPDSVAQRIAPEHPYWSASYGEVCRAVDREVALRQQRDTLKAALEGLRPFVCVQPIPCSGWKCRESWCPSCCGDEEAEVAVQRAQDALKLADAALATCAPETGENR